MRLEKDQGVTPEVHINKQIYYGWFRTKTELQEKKASVIKRHYIALDEILFTKVEAIVTVI